MRNTMISVIIFLSLLGFVYYANNSLTKLCYSIMEASNEIQVLVENKEWEDAYLISLDIIDKIEEDKLLASVYINHCEVDNVLTEAIRLSTHIKSEEDGESLVSSNVLYRLANNIIDINKTNIQNIF